MWNLAGGPFPTESQSLTFGFNVVLRDVVDKPQVAQMPKGCEETSFQPSGNVRNALPSGNRFVHSRYHGAYGLGRHQQHRGESVGAPLQRRRRPWAAGDGEALPDVAIEQKVAELVGEREAKPPRIGV